MSPFHAVSSSSITPLTFWFYRRNWGQWSHRLLLLTVKLLRSSIRGVAYQPSVCLWMHRALHRTQQEHGCLLAHCFLQEVPEGGKEPTMPIGDYEKRRKVPFLWNIIAQSRHMLPLFYVFFFILTLMLLQYKFVFKYITLWYIYLDHFHNKSFCRCYSIKNNTCKPP